MGYYITNLIDNKNMKEGSNVIISVSMFIFRISWCIFLALGAGLISDLNRRWKIGTTKD